MSCNMRILSVLRFYIDDMSQKEEVERHTNMSQRLIREKVGNTIKRGAHD